VLLIIVLVVIVVVVTNWQMGLRIVLVSPRSERSSVTPLVNRASSSSLVFDIRLRLVTLSTARSQVSRNGPRIYIFLRERAQGNSKGCPYSFFFRIIGDSFCSAKLRLFEWPLRSRSPWVSIYGGVGGLLSPRPVVLLWAWDLHTGISNITD